MNQLEPAGFRKVLGAYPTGVCAITSRSDDGQLLGMIVGSFTSVSLAPPLVGFLPGRSSHTWSLIERTGRFCVNVLSSDQLPLCQLLAKPELAVRFTEIDCRLTENSRPAIAGSIATIECNIQSIQEAGDHWFVLGSVIALNLLHDANPLLFHRGRYGGFAEQRNALCQDLD
jgi:3-hydroxy-9,10-secoandrosta-1,3,5(10)-triene-9,17-dione monooxygenase reductase component